MQNQNNQIVNNIESDKCKSERSVLADFATVKLLSEMLYN